jgi:hypothetical protein
MGGRWTQALLLDGHLELAEPKALRYPLLYMAARIVRHARRAILRLQATWPWAAAVARGSPQGCARSPCAAEHSQSRHGRWSR